MIPPLDLHCLPCKMKRFFVILQTKFRYLLLLIKNTVAAPVAQWVTCWPADLAVLSLSPTGGGNLFNRKWGSMAHSLSLSPTHCPDMT